MLRRRAFSRESPVDTAIGGDAQPRSKHGFCLHRRRADGFSEHLLTVRAAQIAIEAAVHTELCSFSWVKRLRPRQCRPASFHLNGTVSVTVTPLHSIGESLLMAR